ncbi:MAG TPA: hypothetical protein VNT20_23500 [Flavisolibacter sp.]|jgi:hypothetical protein|nr:hypothetical protein [Flavisolibacter sp.]
MKIRIQGNSLRFRLKQFEVEALAEKKIVKEVISFGEEEKYQLQFVLQIVNEEFSLEQKTTFIQLNIPENIAAEWASTELVGFEQNIRTAKGKEINILVEKDFKCLTRSDEEEVDSYPNPMKQC